MCRASRGVASRRCVALRTKKRGLYPQLGSCHRCAVLMLISYLPWVSQRRRRLLHPRLNSFRRYAALWRPSGAVVRAAVLPPAALTMFACRRLRLCRAPRERSDGGTPPPHRHALRASAVLKVDVTTASRLRPRKCRPASRLRRRKCRPASRLRLRMCRLASRCRYIARHHLYIMLMASFIVDVIIIHYYEFL